MSRDASLLIASLVLVGVWMKPSEARPVHTRGQATSVLVASVDENLVQPRPNRVKKKTAWRKRRGLRRNRRAARRAFRRNPNLPTGWSWPPTRAMRRQGSACLEQLTELGVAWKRGRRRRNVATPVVVPNMTFGGLVVEPIFRKPPFVMDCHLAKALATIGPSLIAVDVTKLRFSSIHDFRRVRGNGRAKRSLSRHAYGLAIDVYEMETKTGQRLAVKESYVVEPDDVFGPTPFLNEVEQVNNVSEEFRLVLTPGNDPKSHYDHFHLEAKVEEVALTKRQKRRKRLRRRKRMASGVNKTF